MQTFVSVVTLDTAYKPTEADIFVTTPGGDSFKAAIELPHDPSDDDMGYEVCVWLRQHFPGIKMHGHTIKYSSSNNPNIGVVIIEVEADDYSHRYSEKDN